MPANPSKIKLLLVGLFAVGIAIAALIFLRTPSSSLPTPETRNQVAELVAGVVPMTTYINHDSPLKEKLFGQVFPRPISPVSQQEIEGVEVDCEIMQWTVMFKGTNDPNTDAVRLNLDKLYGVKGGLNGKKNLRDYYSDLDYKESADGSYSISKTLGEIECVPIDDRFVFVGDLSRRLTHRSGEESELAKEQKEWIRNSDIGLCVSMPMVVMYLESLESGGSFGKDRDRSPRKYKLDPTYRLAFNAIKKLRVLKMRANTIDGEPVVEIELSAKDPASAESFLGNTKGIEMALYMSVGSYKRNLPRHLPKKLADSATAAADRFVASAKTLDATANGSKISLVLSKGFVDDFCKAFVEPISYSKKQRADMLSRERNQRSAILGMHSILSSERSWSRFIFDSKRTPLLSWRVAILPHIGEGELYTQFRLDEPWDSKHNIKLVKRMPEVFALHGNEQAVAEGKTTMRLLYGPGTYFENEVGFSEPSIPSTSRKLALLHADDQFATEWTKPDNLLVAGGDIASMAKVDHYGFVMFSKADGRTGLSSATKLNLNSSPIPIREIEEPPTIKLELPLPFADALRRR